MRFHIARQHLGISHDSYPTNFIQHSWIWRGKYSKHPEKLLLYGNAELVLVLFVLLVSIENIVNQCHNIWNGRISKISSCFFMLLPVALCYWFIVSSLPPVFIRLWSRCSQTDSVMYKPWGCMWSFFPAQRRGALWGPFQMLRMEDWRLVQGRTISNLSA